MLNRRENAILPSSGGVPSFGAAFTVMATPVGAVAAASSAGGTITVDSGHSFRAGDKALIRPGSDNVFTAAIASVTATTLVWTSESYTVSADDQIVNLGPDTGTGSPNYDASPMKTYVDPDAGSLWANATVTADSQGQYEYYHKGDGRFWELIRDASGTPWAAVQGFGGVAGKLNVCDFGAAGDGATDDSLRCQAAVDAAAATSASVSFPGHTFMIDSNAQDGPLSLTVAGIKLASNVSLLGEKDARLVEVTHSSQSAAILRGDDVENVEIRGLRLTGDRDTHTGSTGSSCFGISLFGCTGVTISDCYIEDAYSSGIMLGTGQVTAAACSRITIQDTYLYFCRISNIKIVDATDVTISRVVSDAAGGTHPTNANAHGAAPESGLDITPSSTKFVEEFKVVDSDFINCEGPGVNLDRDAGVRINWGVLSDCRFTSNTGDGLYAELVTQVVFTGCLSNSNAGNGFQFDTCLRTSLSGCYAGLNDLNGFLLDTCTHMLLSGCDSMHNDQDGIEVIVGTQSVISGCYSHGNSLSPTNTHSNILVTSDSNAVIGCKVLNDGTGTALHGINVSGDDNYIAGNDCVSGGSTPITDTGTDNVLVGNTIGPNADATLFASGTSQYLKWIDASTRFDFSHLIRGKANLELASANEAQWINGQSSIEVTLDTGDLISNVTNFLPANSIIDGVVARVTEVIDNVTNWALGDAGFASRFLVATTDLALDTTKVGMNHWQPAVYEMFQVAAEDLLITCTGSQNTTGKIRLTIFYRQFVPPTS